MGKKGKAPKGRAGAKKKAQKGNQSNNSSPWQNKFVKAGGGGQDMSDDDAYNYKGGFRGFAQNNNKSGPRSFTPQSSNVKLRHQAISFVAAGAEGPADETPSKKPHPEDAEFVAAEDGEDEDIDFQGGDDIDDSTLQTNIVVDTDEVSEGGMAKMNLHSSGEMSAEDTTGPTGSDVGMEDVNELREEVKMQEEELFVVDTAGDDKLAPPPSKAKGKRPARRAPSPSPSDSSDDVVVFHGRGKARNIDDPVKPQPSPQAPAQKTTPAQNPSSQPQKRADPLAAWNNAARTLPQEYSKGTSTASAQKEAPREDTIKETFKKTSGNQGRLGGPRKSEKEEVTVHDASGSRPVEPSLPPATEAHSTQQEQPHVADDLLRALAEQPQDQQQTDDAWLSSATVAQGWGASTSKADGEVNPDAKWAPAPAGSWWKRKNKTPRPDLDIPAEEKAAIDRSPPKVTRVAFAEPGSSKQVAAGPGVQATEKGEDGAEESIDALRAEFKQTLRNKKRTKLAIREKDEIKLPQAAASTSRRGKRGRKKDNRELRAPIESEDDDDGEAAYDDYMANLAAQMASDEAAGDGFVESSFARTTGLGGASMMVDGQTFGEGEVLKSHAEMMNGGDEDEWTSSDDERPIGQDLSDLSSDSNLDYDEISDDDDGSYRSSDLDKALENEEREMWEDEEDLRQRRQDAMNDERLAHLIAKQQEFGIETDDLVIDDGFDMDGVGDVDEARTGLANMTTIVHGQRKKNKTSRSSGGRKGFSFPDASALADTVDQYGEAGFDIMDFDRPSLRPTKKGRKGKLPAELETISDDELKENMSNTWENDRAKKRLKKAEREELRSQGMLGASGRKGKADLTEKYKYQDGMSEAQILQELRQFLQDEGQQSRPFPPMAKGARKQLHEVANTLGLKSKSAGTGKDRFPALYKTRQTAAYSEELFRDVWGQANFLKFSRKAKKLKSPRASGWKKGGKGGGAGNAAVSINHGEIVGAGAPAMGQENKGFKFMQKMGWTPGMSLGREGEGRLVPVEQMMRVGRAGLG